MKSISKNGDQAMMSASEIFSDMPYTGSYFITLIDNQPLQIEPVGYVYDSYTQIPGGFMWRLGAEGAPEIFAYLDKGVPDLETLVYVNAKRKDNSLQAVESALIYGRNDRVLEEVKSMLRSVCVPEIAA